MRMLEGLTSGEKEEERRKGGRGRGWRKREGRKGEKEGERREAMVCENFFFAMNYLSTMPTSVDDLEFFLQVTKSLDHLRREEAQSVH